MHRQAHSGMHRRDLNVATSRSVFAGPYITSKDEEEKFGEAFLHMTEGFLALPICIPGTAVWKAKKGRLYILGVLEKAAAKSKAAMKACLVCIVSMPHLMGVLSASCCYTNLSCGSCQIPAHCSNVWCGNSAVEVLLCCCAHIIEEAQVLRLCRHCRLCRCATECCGDARLSLLLRMHRSQML